MTKPANSKGFTLIEMLIVLAIISVIIGALISWINPARQFNKANVAATASIATKIVTSIEGYYATFGDYPTCVELLEEIDGVEGVDPADETNTNDVTDGCNSTTPEVGSFIIPGIALPNDCDSGSGGAYGASSSSPEPCAFRYEYNSTASTVCLGVRIPEEPDGSNYLLWNKDLNTPTNDSSGLEMDEYNASTFTCD